jgi:hypothetical protein
MSQTTFPVKHKEVGKGLCPVCKNTVTFIAATDTWVYNEATGEQEHRDYGTPEVIHCNQRHVADAGGVVSYPLEVKRG